MYNCRDLCSTRRRQMRWRDGDCSLSDFRQCPGPFNFAIFSSLLSWHLCSLLEAATTIEPDLVPRCSIKLFRQNAPIERRIKPSENAMNQFSTPYSTSKSRLDRILVPRLPCRIFWDQASSTRAWTKRLKIPSTTGNDAEAMNSSSERVRMIVVLTMCRNLGRQDQVVWKT
jgi:hypothetical protein